MPNTRLDRRLLASARAFSIANPKPGSELGDYRFFEIEPGDLVLSNIQAWEGAIALATDSR